MIARVVADTDVVVSAHKAPSPSSPAREMFRRWSAGEFLISVCTPVEFLEELRASFS